MCATHIAPCVLFIITPPRTKCDSATKESRQHNRVEAKKERGERVGEGRGISIVFAAPHLGLLLPPPPGHPINFLGIAAPLSPASFDPVAHQECMGVCLCENKRNSLGSRPRHLTERRRRGLNNDRPTQVEPVGSGGWKLLHTLVHT